jgi:hypothetical protein
MTVNFDAIQNLVTCGKNPLALWADNGYSISGVTECARFLPHASVKGDSKILDDDANSRRHSSTH